MATRAKHNLDHRHDVQEEDPVDAQVRRRLVGTWFFLLLLVTAGVLAFFFVTR